MKNSTSIKETALEKAAKIASIAGATATVASLYPCSQGYMDYKYLAGMYVATVFTSIAAGISQAIRNIQTLDEQIN